MTTKEHTAETTLASKAAPPGLRSARAAGMRRDWPVLIGDAVAVGAAIALAHILVGSVPGAAIILTLPVWLALGEVYGIYDTRSADRKPSRDLRALVAWSLTGTIVDVLLLSTFGIEPSTQAALLTLWPMVAVAAVSVRIGCRVLEARLGWAPAAVPERRLPAWRPVAAIASGDAVALCVASALGIAGPLRHADAPLIVGGPALFVVVLMASLFAHGAYRAPFSAGTGDDFAKVLRALTIGALVCLAAFAVQGNTSVPVAVVAPAWVVALLTVPSGRWLIGSMHRRAARNGILGQQTVVMTGSLASSNDVARRLLDDPRHGLRPVGMLAPDGEPFPGTLAVPVVGQFDDLLDAVHRLDVRHLIVDLTHTRPRGVSLDGLMRTCSAIGVEVSIVPPVRRSVNSRLVVTNVAGVPLLKLSSLEALRAGLGVKHAIDRTVGTLLLVLALPVLLVLAALVRISSPGPVLYRQRRVGRDGRPFDLLKFRSMSVDTEISTFRPSEGTAPGGIEGADRRTAVGRFLRRTCLDELPQLINVVRGEMSLVGPRPERPEFVESFRVTHSDYDDRLRVKAGMTGLAQVRGLRGQSSMSERLLFDNSYIENWSLGLDFKVLLLTLPAIIRTRLD